MLKFKSISNANEIGRERLVFEANQDEELAEYAVFAANKSNENGPQAGNVPHAFWFRYQKLVKGDLVVLYTKDGTISTKNNEGGGTSYFYYWGLDAPLWNGKAHALLVATPNWASVAGGPEA